MRNFIKVFLIFTMLLTSIAPPGTAGIFGSKEKREEDSGEDSRLNRQPIREGEKEEESLPINTSQTKRNPDNSSEDSTWSLWSIITYPLCCICACISSMTRGRIANTNTQPLNQSASTGYNSINNSSA